MGNEISHLEGALKAEKREVRASDEPSDLSLDELGGWDRPPIKRGDSLNKKLEWLQQAVKEQADLMEHELFKMPETNRPMPKPRTEKEGEEQNRRPWVGNYVKSDPLKRTRTVPRLSSWNIRGETSTVKGNTLDSRENKGKQKLPRVSSGNYQEIMGIKVPTWRINVERAKKKAYLYLKTIMMDVRHRKSYATSIREDSVPAYVMMALGKSAPSFCRHQAIYCNFVSEEGRKNPILVALEKGRRWKRNALRKKNQGKKPVLADKSQNGNEEEDESRPPSPSPKSLIANQIQGLISRIEESARQSGGLCRDDEQKLDYELEIAGKLAIQFSEYDNVLQRLRSVNEEEAARKLMSLMNDSRLMMQMHANRANARWVEEAEWVSPHVYDPSSLVLGRADSRLYKQIVKSMLEEGKIALQLIDAGEEMPTNSDADDGTLSSALTIDLWKPLQDFYPWKVPLGDRLEGLSVFSRRLLQSVVDIQKIAGVGAVKKLKVILCIDEDEEPAIRELLPKMKFYGLTPENVIIIKIPRYPGVLHNMQDSQMTSVQGSPRLLAGTGWGVLALKWPGVAFTVDPQTSRSNPLDGTVLQWLASVEVEWINTQLIFDWERFGPDTTINMDFCATAIYCNDDRNANMAMEVIRSGSAGNARSHMSLVLGRKENNRDSCNLKITDLQTPKTRMLMMQAESEENVVTCTHRYMIKTKTLQEIVLGAHTFRPDIEVHGQLCYLSFNLADLSSAPGAHCAAIIGQSKGPCLKTTVYKKLWYHDIGPHLAHQDIQSAFQLAAISSSTDQAPVVVKSKMQTNKKGSVIVIFVVDNLVSKMAHRTVRLFLRSEMDELHIVTSIVGDESGDKANELLGSFQDNFARNKVIHKVLKRGQAKVLDVMEQYVKEVSADLVVIGSEQLSKNVSEVMGSFAMTVVKSLTFIPVLVVKVNTSGDCHKPQETYGRPAVRCMFEVRPTCRPLLDFTLDKLDHSMDKMYLAKPRAIDNNGLETPAAQRMLSTFADQVTANEFAVIRRPLRGEPTKSLTQAVSADKIDILAVQAPGGKSTPPHIINLLRAAKSSVLVFRTHEQTNS
ncbi:hypothetical protein BSKO_07892 [Bryopsis sp. KO-2023]|nr:hypothetical protein BSKO_07892 [Bryopsis sp. KO-2023]